MIIDSELQFRVWHGQDSQMLGLKGDFQYYTPKLEIQPRVGIYTLTRDNSTRFIRPLKVNNISVPEYPSRRCAFTKRSYVREPSHFWRASWIDAHGHE